MNERNKRGKTALDELERRVNNRSMSLGAALGWAFQAGREYEADVRDNTHYTGESPNCGECGKPFDGCKGH